MIELQQGGPGMQGKVDAGQLIPDGYRRVTVLDLKEKKDIFLIQFSDFARINQQPWGVKRDKPFVRLKKGSNTRSICYLVSLGGTDMKFQDPVHDFIWGKLDANGDGKIFIVKI